MLVGVAEEERLELSRAPTPTGLANQPLNQFEYSSLDVLVGEAGFEPATTCVQSTEADQTALLADITKPYSWTHV